MKEFTLENADCNSCPAFGNICESMPDNACIMFRKNLDLLENKVFVNTKIRVINDLDNVIGMINREI